VAQHDQNIVHHQHRNAIFHPHSRRPSIVVGANHEVAQSRQANAKRRGYGHASTTSIDEDVDVTLISWTNPDLDQRSAGRISGIPIGKWWTQERVAAVLAACGHTDLADVVRDL
jgi:hypothetical protein